jgi:hypothetical protein
LPTDAAKEIIRKMELEMRGEIKPTGSEIERQKGRIALWLDPEDILWMSKHCCCPPDAEKDTTDRCARIRFRASAALHKAGIGHDWKDKDA